MGPIVKAVITSIELGRQETWWTLQSKYSFYPFKDPQLIDFVDYVIMKNKMVIEPIGE